MFGSVVSDNDQEVVNAIRQGDAISSITIEGDIDGLRDSQAARLAEWNATLDESFPISKRNQAHPCEASF